MNKIKRRNNWKNINSIIGLFFFLLLTIYFSILLNIKKEGYSLFVEFTDAYGLKEGTSVNMRGMNIGYIKNLKMNPSSVLVSIYITSSKIIIPKKSIIETNQTSLFNNTTLDIIPLDKQSIDNSNSINVFNADCLQSTILCNNQYILGDRGLNYDDLIRATTRIAQRFDDPRFFNLFYLFLQNSLEISDDIVILLKNISDMSNWFSYSLRYMLLNNI